MAVAARPGEIRLTGLGAGERVGVLALDVALLLEGAAHRRAVALNRALAPGGFAFDDSHLPHLTLVQVGVAEDRLAEVYRRVEAAARGWRPLRLRAASIARPGTTSHLVVEGNARLGELHERLLAALLPLARPVDAAAFYAAGEPPRPRDLEWVNAYHRQASGPRFEPHVTLGVGAPAGRFRPFVFAARCLAVCQLGRFCTCRVRLWSSELGRPAPPARAAAPRPGTRPGRGSRG